MYIYAPCFSYMMMNVYEKYNDMLIGSPLLFACGVAHVKSIKSGGVGRSGAPCFLYAAMHI
jgi:hypothetical protein